MRPYRALPLDLHRYGDLLPGLAAALLFAGIAIEAKLAPPTHVAVEFPPAADVTTTPGALPQFSLPSDEAAERDIVDTTVLPREAVPDERTPVASPSVAAAAPDLAPPLAAAQIPALPAAQMPLALGGQGAGNLHLRTSRSSALSALATDLMQQVKRLHPVPAQTRVKRPAPLKVERPAAHPAHAITAGKPLYAVPGVGGPTPLTGVLGGPSPLASKSATVVDGTTFRRRF